MDKQTDEKPKTNWLAIASFVLGILGLILVLLVFSVQDLRIFLYAFPISLFGLFLGVSGITKDKGRQLATWGIVVSAISLFLLLVGLCWMLIHIIYFSQ